MARRLERRPGWRPPQDSSDPDDNDGGEDLLDDEDADGEDGVEEVEQEQRTRAHLKALAERSQAAAAAQLAPPLAMPLPIPARPWLQPVDGKPNVFVGEEQYELPDDGGDMTVVPVGQRGKPVRMPERDLDAWMGKIEPLLLNFPGMYKLQIIRTSPNATRQGTFCDGAVGETTHCFNAEFIREKYGGYRYDIKLLGPGKNAEGETVSKFTYLRTFYGLRIPGDPIIPGQTREEPEGTKARREEPAMAAPHASAGLAGSNPLLEKLVDAKLARDERLEVEAQEMREQLLQQKHQQPPPQPMSELTVPSGTDPTTALLLKQLHATNERLQTTLMDMLKRPSEAPQPPPQPARGEQDAIVVALLKALESKNQPPPAAPQADKEEVERLHKMIAALQQDLREAGEARRKETEELARHFREEADNLRRAHDKQIDDLRVQHRDEVSSLRSDTRMQAEAQVASVRQQYEGLLGTVRQGYDDRIRIMQEQLDDYRGQTMDTRGKLATAESEANRARLDEVVAKTEARIAASIPKQDGLGGVGELTKMVTTFKTMRDVVETIAPPAAAAAANPAPTGVVDRVLGIGEKLAGSNQAGKVLEVVLDRVMQRGQQQAQQQVPQQQPTQPNPSVEQVNEGSRAWEEERRRQHEAERQRREEARARERAQIFAAAPAYRPVAAPETAPLPGGPTGDAAPAQQPQQSTASIAQDMGLSVDAALASVEQAALLDIPPEKFVDDMLRNSFGFTREEAIAILGDNIDPRAALAESGITRDALSMRGAAYFDLVLDYMTSALRSGKASAEPAAEPPAEPPAEPAAEPPVETPPDSE